MPPIFALRQERIICFFCDLVIFFYLIRFCFSLSLVLGLGLRLAKCIYTDAVKKLLLIFFIINLGHAHSCLSLCILFCNYAILNCICECLCHYFCILYFFRRK